MKAKRFLDTTSVAAMLDALFKRQENRCLVLRSVLDMLHVGFIFPDGGLTGNDMIRESNKAGFCSDHSMIASTVISRELGELAGRTRVPTDIFIARRDQVHGRSGYVEAFIPAADVKLVRSWIEMEIGTHIGLTITDPRMLPAAQDAFEAEGFRMPSFMQGKPITNLHRGLIATYHEKSHGEGKVRIEVLTFLEGIRR